MAHDAVYRSAEHGITRGLPSVGARPPPLWILSFDRVIREIAQRERGGEGEMGRYRDLHYPNDITSLMEEESPERLRDGRIDTSAGRGRR